MAFGAYGPPCWSYNRAGDSLWVSVEIYLMTRWKSIKVIFMTRKKIKFKNIFKIGRTTLVSSCLIIFTLWCFTWIHKSSTTISNMPSHYVQVGADMLFAINSNSSSAVSTSLSLELDSSGSSLMRARYFLAINSQSTTFSIFVALLKLSWEPIGLRWTTDKRVESESLGLVSR